MSEPIHKTGVQGAPVLDPHEINVHRRCDLKLLEKMLCAGVEIPDVVREKIVPLLAKKMFDPDTADRTVVSCASVISRLMRINVDILARAMDLTREPPAAAGFHVHVGGQIREVEDGDWYGNRERLASLSSSVDPSNGHSVGPSQVQSGELRPPVGQNGDGPSGNGEGPRTDSGLSPGPDDA